jgi:hypothetical protein
LGDRRSDGESSCNSGDGTGQMAQPWMFMMMMMKLENAMEMNVEKTKVMRISRQPFPVKIYDRPKTTRECGIF